MPVSTRILPSAYYDSVTLMQVAQALIALPGVRDAAVVMGTPANHDLLKDAGMATPEAAAALPNDLVVVVLAETEDDAAAAIDQVDRLLATRKTAKPGGAAGRRPRSMRAAITQSPDANLVIISVAGRYAAREARVALESGLNVMLYSDNVTVEDEIALKDLAGARGLLCMGPDAGTAIINGIGLGFANAVPRGPIGIVSAAGTGLQSVSSDIARRGSGVSQAIGTGGRDLSQAVGGRTMLAGLQALQADPQTELIVLISKPPAEAIAQKLLEQVRLSKKPTVVCFLGADPGMIERAGAIPANTLEQAAAIAAALAQNKNWHEAVVACEEATLAYLPQAKTERARLQPGQRFIHGLYTGGTFCYEAQILAEGLTENVYSNAPVGGQQTADGGRQTAADGRRSAVGGRRSGRPRLPGSRRRRVHRGPAAPHARPRAAQPHDRASGRRSRSGRAAVGCGAGSMAYTPTRPARRHARSWPPGLAPRPPAGICR